MTFDEFVTNVKDLVSIRMGEGYEVVTEEILKNNSCLFTGLIIREINDEEYKIAPTLYLESWYSQYKKEGNIDKVVDGLIETYYQCNKYRFEFNKECIERDKITDKVFYRIVNYENNKLMLEGSPYIPYLDLAITFHCLCSDSEKHINSFRVTNSILRTWNYTIDDMFQFANNNMNRLFPGKLCNMGDMISEMMGVHDSNADIDTEVEFYILTNKQSINGAAALLYTTKIQELSQRYDSDILILPSSIHELLLIPIIMDVDFDYFRNLVNEVNQLIVDPEERLSDNIYVFSKEDGNVTIA